MKLVSRTFHLLPKISLSESVSHQLKHCKFRSISSTFRLHKYVLNYTILFQLFCIIIINKYFVLFSSTSSMSIHSICSSDLIGSDLVLAWLTIILARLPMYAFCWGHFRLSPVVHTSENSARTIGGRKKYFL